MQMPRSQSPVDTRGGDRRRDERRDSRRDDRTDRRREERRESRRDDRRDRRCDERRDSRRDERRDARRDSRRESQQEGPTDGEAGFDFTAVQVHTEQEGCQCSVGSTACTRGVPQQVVDRLCELFGSKSKRRAEELMELFEDAVGISRLETGIWILLSPRSPPSSPWVRASEK